MRIPRLRLSIPGRAIATLLFAATASDAAAGTSIFFDDFNRPDGQPGSGWQVVSDVPGGGFSIANGHVTILQPDSTSAISRTIDYSTITSIRADITDVSGYGGIGNRFSTEFNLHSDGTQSSGLSVVFTRGDNNYSDSAISLRYQGDTLASIKSPFEFDGQITPTVTLLADGSIAGSVRGSGQSFSFGFAAPGILPLGESLGFTQGGPDGRSSSFIYSTIDNVTISTGTAYDTLIPGSISLYTDGPSIDAVFTPSLFVTLDQAAAALGYSGFNWQQTVDYIPDPNPYRLRENPFETLEPPFLDPVPGGYFTGPENHSYPFYYDNSIIGNYESDDGYSLGFHDLPSDYCLSGGIGNTMPLCGFRNAAPGEAIYFTTYLVGVNLDGTAGDPLFSFKWKSDYNGTVGGTVTLSNELPADPGSGYGGTTLLSTRYYGSSVPEPSAWLLLLSGFTAAGAALRIQRRQIARSDRLTLRVRV